MEQLKVNWTGPFYHMEGYGYLNRKLMEAVHRAGVKVTPVAPSSYIFWSTQYFAMAGIDTNKPTVLVSVPGNPGEHQKHTVFEKLPARVILYTMYESTNLPEHWADYINESAERVIVPSEFCQQVFRTVLRSENYNVPVHLVRGGIDPAQFKPVLDWVDRPFTFMALADRGNRKGWDVVWRAFQDEFGMSNDVRLIFKARAHNLTEAKEHQSDPRISLWRSDIENQAEVYSAADCFVFPSRGEGFGLPPREAAACAIPVICSKNTGLDDEIEEWALPVSCKQTKVPQGLLHGNGDWFEPSIEDVRKHMRYVYENRDEARQRALKAREWLVNNRTWDHAAKQMIDVLKLSTDLTQYE